SVRPRQSRVRPAHRAGRPAGEGQRHQARRQRRQHARRDESVPARAVLEDPRGGLRGQSGTGRGDRQGDVPRQERQGTGGGKKEMLKWAEAEAKRDRDRKVTERKNRINKLWNEYQVTTPYGKCRLLDFPETTVEAPLKFGNKEIKQLAAAVVKFQEQTLET